MRRLAVGLFAAVAVMTGVSVADAHEENGYSWTGCGGDYTSPWTGAHWVDCYDGQEAYQYWPACDNTCTQVGVFRLYRHYRNGVFHHRSWRLVDYRWQ
jgi:hypothetical protein